MSWSYLQEPVVEFSEECYAVTLASELVKSRNTQGNHFWLVSEMDYSRASLYGMTSKHSGATTQNALNTSSSLEASEKNLLLKEDSPAQTYLPLGQIVVKMELQKDLKEKALAFGLNSCELLEKCDLRVSLAKTPEILELRGLSKYSKDLMSWGIMQDGVCSSLGLSVQTTTVPECGYLPTPTSHNSKEGAYPAEFRRNTPTLSAQVGGKVNPSWNEWRMGWPINHTDLKPLGTDKIQEWFGSHGIFFQHNDASKLTGAVE